MLQETVDQVKQMILSGKTHRETARILKISTASIHIILTGKKYPYKQKGYKGVWVRGLSVEHKKELRNIAKNKDSSRNKLLLSYIRAGINAENSQNKIYED